MRARPISPAALAEAVADRVTAASDRVRIIIDGAPAVDPGAIGEAVTARLRERGRFALHVRAGDFLLPASQRFELGRTSADAFYHGWRDLAGLRREVLDPAGPSGSGRVLPALWRVDIDRSARAKHIEVPSSGVVVVTGDLLLGAGLPAELEVHLEASGAALARRTPPELAWTLPAYQRYRDEVAPATFAGMVARMDDLRHPALVERDFG